MSTIITHITRQIDRDLDLIHTLDDKIHDLTKSHDHILGGITRFFTSIVHPANTKMVSELNGIKESAANEVKFLTMWKVLELDDVMDPKVHMKEMKKLFDSRLIWWIVGFRNISESAKALHPITTDDQNRLCLKKEGELVPVNDLDIQWDNDKNSFVDSNGKGWLYLSPDGLVQLDRHEFTNEQLRPIHKLTEQEMDQVREHASKFYNSNIHPDPSPDKPKTAVLQFHTSPRFFGIDKMPLLGSITEHIPVHVSMRLINENGEIFSTTIEMSPEDLAELGRNKSTFLKVRDATTTLIDYEEFRTHEGRLVTNVPITQADFDHILDNIKKYKNNGLRFQFIKQNCVKLAVNTLSDLGEEVPVQKSAKAIFLSLLPKLRNLPVVGPTLVTEIRRIQQETTQRTPPWMLSIIHKVGKLLLLAPSLIANFFVNSLLVVLGSTKVGPKRYACQSDCYSQNSMNYFDRVVKTPSDLFDDNMGTYFSPAEFIRWQLDQGSTQVHAYDERGPVLTVLPIQKQDGAKRTLLEDVYDQLDADRRQVYTLIRNSKDLEIILQGKPNVYKELKQAIFNDNIPQFRDILINEIKGKKVVGKPTPLEVEKLMELKDLLKTMVIRGSWKDMHEILTVDKDAFLDDLEASLQSDKPVDELAAQIEQMRALPTPKQQIAFAERCGRVERIWKCRQSQQTTNVEKAIDAFLPTESIETDKKTIMIATCSFGGGHISVQNAIADRIGDKYEIKKVDIPREVIGEFDTVTKLAKKFGFTYTSEELFAFLQRNNMWKTIKFIKGISKKELSITEYLNLVNKKEKEKQRKIISYVLKNPADMLVSTYTFNNSHLLRAAEAAEIPFLHVQSDCGADVDWPHYVDYLHYKTAVPYDLPSCKVAIEGKVKKEQIVYTGYPVRKEFDHDIDKAAVCDKYGIKEEEKVVFFTNGKVSTPSPFPQLLVQSKREFAHPMTLFVLCGEDKQRIAELNALNSSQEKNPNVRIIPLGRQDASGMNELLRVSNVVVGKPGGGTVGETIKTETKMLGDGTNGLMPWEIVNIQVLEKQLLGKLVKKKNDFLEELDTLLNAENASTEWKELKDCTTSLSNVIAQMFAMMEKK